jgi:hypothetical protein
MGHEIFRDLEHEIMKLHRQLRLDPSPRARGYRHALMDAVTVIRKRRDQDIRKRQK